MNTRRCDSYGKTKVKFDRRLAVKKARRYTIKDDEPMCVYHCKVCGTYHVGHDRRKERKR